MKYSHSYGFANRMDNILELSSKELMIMRSRLKWAINELEEDGDVGMHIPTLQDQIGALNIVLNSVLQERAKWSAYAKARLDSEQRNQQFQ